MYEMQCIKRNNAFIQFIHDQYLVPNYHQKRLMNAIRTALAKKLTYHSDLYAHVVEEMMDVLSPDILAMQFNNKVEHGMFGMEIYYAKYAVEAMMLQEGNQQALDKLITSGLLRIGKVMKGLKCGARTYSTVTVMSFDKSKGLVNLHAKRRGVKGFYKFPIGANDTRILSLLVNIENKDEMVKKKENVTTVSINIGENRRHEYTCQI
jgi:hypothetical protein